MKVVYTFGFIFLILGATKAQRNISILLVDDKEVPLKAEQVGEMKVSLCGQDDTTIIYSETFISPPIISGRANLEIGVGAKRSAYIEAVNTHFKNLVRTFDSRILVITEVTMKNGKILKFNKEIELNDPVPVFKVFDNQNISILPQGINMAAGTRYANYNARNLFLIDTSRELISSNYVDHTGMNLYEGDDQAAQFSKDGIGIFTPDNQFAQFLLHSGLKLQDNNYTSEFSLHGGKVTNRLNENNFNFGTNEFSLGTGSSNFWYFNHTGGGFNPNTNISHLFTTNSYGIKDNSSKRETKFFYNGVTGYYDGNPKINLGMATGGTPIFNFLNPAGKLFYNQTTNADGGIDISTYNPEGAITYRNTTLNGTGGRNPYVYISLNGGAPGAGMYYNSQNVAVLFATIKNFRMDHPFKPDQDIVYASLEGPEAAAYCRGKAQISNGKIFIAFPEHFQYVCSPEDLTVQLTPRSALSKGLAVTQIGPEGFQVEELMQGKGSYEFYWEVKGVRKGFENYQVMRPKTEIMPVPFKKPETKE